MKEALKKYGAKAVEKNKRNTTEKYKIREEVLIFSPRTNKFVKKGSHTILPIRMSHSYKLLFKVCKQSNQKGKCGVD